MSTIPPSRTKIAVIGCGYIMRAMYVSALAALEESGQVSTVGVCDLDLAAAEAVAARLSGARAFTKAEEMLRETAPDAVMVLTPESVNARVATAVLRAGLPVYLEKPPAITLTELRDLQAAEAPGPGWVYTAFNRRHTPLFADFKVAPESVRRVSGSLRRAARAVANFPYTAIHVVDSAQALAGQAITEAEIRFTEGPPAAWQVHGQLAQGGECDLELVPNGGDHQEFLVIEAGEGSWELQFSNRSGAYPEGALFLNGKRQPGPEGQSDDPVESMGYAACLRSFLACLRDGVPRGAHTLESFVPTVRIMEAMLRREALNSM